MDSEEFARRNMYLRHAIQTGVAYDYERNGKEEQKHLRVGINANMCEVAAMLQLFVDKGLITWDEYYKYSLAELEREKQRYEEKLTQSFGRPISLG